ncbi:nucleoporin [Pseudohyphozyma bogoriensis]|nr:nucleoporin [Pseudohyphozyma bogoriensis]
MAGLAAAPAAPVSTVAKVDLKGKGKATPSDTPSSIPFSTALNALELSSTTGILPSHLSSFLSQPSSLASLQSPHAPFPPSPSALAKLKAGNTGPDAIPGGQVSAEETKLVEEVSQRFGLDEGRALEAVRHAAGDGKSSKGVLDEDEWDRVTAYLFEERLAVLGLVSLLLRCRDDPAHPVHALSLTLLPDILTPTFPTTLLTSFQTRCSTPLPSAVRSSSTHSQFWTKSLLREQKALLELVFLVFYSPLPPDAAVLQVVLDVVQATQWGQRQENFGYFDAETKALVKEVGDLLAVIVVESLNLEEAVALFSSSSSSSASSPIPKPGDPDPPTTSIYHPSNLASLNDRITTLAQADPVRSSPLVLGWAFHLSLLTNSFTTHGVPPSYHSFASSSNLIASPSPLFQLFASHALAPSSNLFPHLLDILSSPLFSPASASTSSTSSTRVIEEPNLVGYLSVLRALISSLPLLIRLSFLPAESFSDLVKVISALYGNPAAGQLCARFWETMEEETMGDEEEGETKVLDLARSRFPVRFGDLVTLVKGFQGGAGGIGIDEEELGARCARGCWSYLSGLESLTMAMNPSTTLLSEPYEISGYPELVYRVTREIQVSRRLRIPVGTTGRLVSEQGRKPVVIAWDVQWSAWRLFADVLEEYAGLKVPGGGDVFGAGAADRVVLPVIWDSDEERDADVVSVLEIFTEGFERDAKLATRVVNHMSEGASQFHFVEVLFKILEKSLAAKKTGNGSNKLVSSTLGLIAALLPSFPGVIFTFLRGSTLLFRSRSPSSGWGHDAAGTAILTAERLEGTYPVTLALISLVHALILEDQISSYAVEPAFEELKRGVIVRALTWVRDEVWISYGGWRFKSLAEKYDVGRRVVGIFGLVLEEAELEAKASQGQFGPIATVVVDALLGKASVSLLTPLLSTVTLGPEPILLLRKAFRYSDAQALEDLVEGSFALVRKLVRFRRRVEGTNLSLLERICLSAGTPEGFGTGAGGGAAKFEPLAALARTIVAHVDPKTAILAAKVLTLMCLGSAEGNARPPSLISLVGGSEKAMKFVTEMLAIASDPTAVEGLQVAIWDLMAAIVESQPGLAILLVTGRQYPFAEGDHSKEKQLSEKEKEGDALILSKSVAPPTFRPLPRTAIGVGLETIGTWRESWEAHPALLAAVLRFFDFAWQHLVDYGTALDEFRNKPAPWEKTVDIAFEGAGDEPEGDEDTKAYCHRMMAKAHAVRIIALDIQLEQSRKGEATASSKALLKKMADKAFLAKAMSSAMSNSCAPNLHQGIFGLVHETFPEVPIDALRLPPPSHPLDDAREFGSGYLYSLPILRRKLDGFMSDANSMVDAASLADVVERTSALNLNFSLLEAQISNTRSWHQLLEIALPLIRRDAAASNSVVNTAPLVAGDMADEDRSSVIITTVHEERLAILLTMTEVLQGVTGTSVKEDLVPLLTEVGRLFASEILPPLESVNRRTTPQFHRTLFRVAYFVFRKLNVFAGVGRTTFSASQNLELPQATETIMRVMITATRDLLILARAKPDVELDQDLALAVAVLGQIVRSPFVPASSVWLAACQKADLFRCAFEVFVYMETVNGRVLYAQHVLDLCLAMSSAAPQAAEQMALDGLITALTNNALSATAEAGGIQVIGPDGERTQQHEIWTSMLALVVSLTSALGESTQFVEQEVTGFVRLYGAQLASVMAWNTDTSLPLARVEEMQSTVALIYGVLKQTNVAPVVSTVLAEQSLFLLQQVVFALLHPNHLANLIEPVTSDERQRLEKEAAVDGDDYEKKPITSSVTLALLQLSRVLVEGLLFHTSAFAVLLREPSQWPVDRAIVPPSATVTSSEKASIGTLFDLATFCLDTLRAPPSTTPAPAAASSPTYPLLPYTKELLSQNAEQTLEGTLLLAATQLGLWLYRSEPVPSRATAVVRREITTELASDLLSVVDRTLNVGKGDKKKSVRWQDAAPSSDQSSDLVRALHAYILEKIRSQ